MREIVLDTETTGFDPEEGDRLVEIGALELVNHIPTGRTYHQYINPERDVPAEAVAVHGLDNERLKDEPIFSQIFTDFLEFVEGGRLVIHNAAFDMKFLNYELKQVGHKGLDNKLVVDTLAMARQKFPGSPASLDALCRRFGIDNSSRELHGALLDSELLAEVYLELIGGRQHGLTLAEESAGQAPGKANGSGPQASVAERKYREPRPHPPLSEEEKKAHADLLEKLTDPMWNDFISDAAE